jgi:hypothetical protein
MEELPVRNDFDGDSEEGSSDEDDGNYLGGTLSGAGLAQTIVDTHTSNELGLVRSEVRRLRSKVERLEHEKEVMVDDFNITTKMLLDRIRVLENEKTGSDSRPQTAAILERVEALQQATWGSNPGKAKHRPEVMRIDEEEAHDTASPAKPTTSIDEAADDWKECGNCGLRIPERNFTSHTVFCYRNNYHCAVCSLVLPVKEKDSHIAEWTDPEKVIDAASERNMERLQAMSSHGADFQTCVHPRTGDTVLHVAAGNSDLALVELCMGYGVDVDPLNEQGQTPLHLAAMKAECTVVRLLVELGADLNICNGIGESPLMLVCRRGASDAARYLVEKKADPEAKTRLGDTPLEIAQRSGFQETVLALSMAGASLRSGTPKRVRNRSSSRHRSGSPKHVVPTVPPRVPTNGSGGSSGYPPLPPSKRPNSPPRASVLAR